MLSPAHILLNDVFQTLCTRADAAVPDVLPDPVCSETWGEYGEAIDFFRAHGRYVPRRELVKHRSFLTFLNDETWEVVLPQVINACLNEGLVDYEILDYVIAALKARRSLSLCSDPTLATLYGAALGILAKFVEQDLGNNDDLYIELSDKCRALLEL